MLRVALSKYKIALAMVFPMAAACSDGSGPGLVARVSLAPADTVLAFGVSHRYRAVVTGVYGQELSGVSLRWNVSNPSILSVDSLGLVTGLRPGTGTVVAAVEGVSGSASVSVTPIRFQHLGLGQLHSCGVSTEGIAYCWGDNPVGELGDSTTLSRLTPVAVSGGHLFTQVDARGRHTCGISLDTSGFCWGWNPAGELGTGGTDGSTFPVPISSSIAIGSIVLGGAHTCALTISNAAYCWGDGRNGELGTGDTVSQTIPTPVVGGLVFDILSAGGPHTCGLTTAGVAYCWGRNLVGELGDGTTIDRSTPTPVAGGLTFDDISVGLSHTCGITQTGDAYCWGRNSLGRLGDGTTNDRHTPTLVVGGLKYSTIVAGDAHTCALTLGGAAYCWGQNVVGQLGQPWESMLESSVPVTVSGGFSFTAIAVGAHHTCGLATDGIAYCWGSNLDGRLGSGTVSPGSPMPIPIFGQQ